MNKGQGGGAGSAPRMAAVPAVGQNTDAVLASLGYAPEQVARLGLIHI
ncbi:hypothetical protein HGQ98_33585 [Achromobacter ruhlandii]|uniref:Uncharacterized protein n=1 Tax=Achromobacter ruhlandii TaxID=72557 RepID=A0A848NU76_9BURK|nr:hypothetical protein [Achromobacter ruhlandii]NMU94041.1 hypothetical protein [Achromobacter ruhlandii]